MDSCAYSEKFKTDYAGAAIYFKATKTNWSTSEYRTHENIVIENNKILNHMSRVGILVSNVNKGKVIGNEITAITDDNGLTNDRFFNWSGASPDDYTGIRVTYSTDIAIKSNSYTDMRKWVTTGILVEDNSDKVFFEAEIDFKHR
jgi:nitrogen regulatory protein PII-like uncharacterized protein